MKTRKLGKTNLDVSVLSFGASSLGGVFRETDDSESVRTVHAAIDCGINYIDVSPYYGLTRAESVLGQAVAQLPRDKFLLSSKAGRYGEAEFDFTAKRIFSSVEESLQRLQTDYLDILFLHDIEFVSPEIILEEAVPALHRLKEQGKIRFTGISGLPLALFEQMLPQIEVDAILSYCHYSLNDNSLLELVPLLKKQNIGLVNASPLSMGLLSTREPSSWHPASKEVKALCQKAAQHCANAGTDIAKLAMQYSTSHADIPTTLVSTASPANIARNAAWIEEPIDEALLQEVLDILQPIHNVSWSSGIERYNQSVATSGKSEGLR
ncbi:aldo/keto reductase [Saccharibacillus sp. JS10]|uniref:aldo/keto reductase n=1 Tax=Saccharibacillus sp. JS10 TaxID=2950552 RepID=UPI00210E7BE6|nr:aldo/keto reductase [Saccharibacillus sp. JS10]MCQ4085466.1 aldo/keto reductase [Saccharibacillus sp. JS10]